MKALIMFEHDVNGKAESALPAGLSSNAYSKFELTILLQCHQTKPIDPLHEVVFKFLGAYISLIRLLIPHLSIPYCCNAIRQNPSIHSMQLFSNFSEHIHLIMANDFDITNVA